MWATAHAGVDARAAALSGPAAGPIPQVDGGAEDSDDGELNSDDDELNSDDDDDEDDEETNFAVCQFEKVQPCLGCTVRCAPRALLLLLWPPSALLLLCYCCHVLGVCC